MLALLPVMIRHRNQFDAQGLANLIWVLAKLVSNGLQPGLRLNTLAVLIHRAGEQRLALNALEDNNIIWNIAKLVDNGVVLTMGHSAAVTVSLSQVSKHLYSPHLWALLICSGPLPNWRRIDRPRSLISRPR